MDKKAVIVVSICFILLLVWYPLTIKYYGGSAPDEAQGNSLDTNSLQRADLKESEAEPIETSSIQAAEVTDSDPLQEEELYTLETEDATYTFTSHGGGLRSVALKHHDLSAGCETNGDKEPTIQQHIALNLGAKPLFSFADRANWQGNGVYEITEADSTVVLTKQLKNGLTIRKEVRVGTNYLLHATVKLTNASTDEIGVPSLAWIMGTAIASGNKSDAYRTKVFWYDGEDTHGVGLSWFENKTLGCIPGTPRPEYDSGALNPVWSAANNQFFTMVAIPSGDGARPRNLARPAMIEGSSVQTGMFADRGVQNEFHYDAILLAPGQEVVREVELYAGPKEYKTLAKLGSDRSNELDLIMDFGFFGMFSKILLLSMNLLHDAWGLAYGMAIVVITFFIKMIFWPLTKASTRSMKRMAAFQPQMKEIQEKYKEDPRKMNQKMMEFMRANKVNPLGGCLPMVIQIPVFMGFFFMIQSAIELRGASFLWACDLSQPDTLFRIPGLDFPINLFPLLMGATQIWQMRLTPPSPGMDPVQQKMMQYMPLIFVVFLYNFSSGLTLYWTVQNLLSILQMKLTKNEPVKAIGASVPGGSASTGPSTRLGGKGLNKKRK